MAEPNQPPDDPASADPAGAVATTDPPAPTPGADDELHAAARGVHAAGSPPPADEPAAPATPPADGATPPAAEPTPAAEPAAPVAVTQEQLQQQATELTNYRQQLTDFHQQLTGFWNDPAFQEAYAVAKAKQDGTAPPAPQSPAANAADPNSGAVPPAGPAERPWKDFQPEDAGQKQLVEYLNHVADQNDALRQELTEKMQGMTTQLGEYQQEVRARKIAAATAEQDAAMTILKAEFPDLVDGGERQQKLEQGAADLIIAGRTRGAEPSVTEALTTAAKAQGYDTESDRLRAKLQQAASDAASARTEPPDQVTPPETPDSMQDASRQVYRDTQGGT